jgi:peptide/nickel transport system permease protein
VIEVLESDYVRMARLKGVPEHRVLVRHALRNALVPSVQVFALVIGWLVGGIVVVEAVFQYPGIGQGLVDAVSARDLPVVQAIALIIAGVYVIVNLIADVITIMITPKLRTAL